MGLLDVVQNYTNKDIRGDIFGWDPLAVAKRKQDDAQTMLKLTMAVKNFMAQQDLDELQKKKAELDLQAAEQKNLESKSADEVARVMQSGGYYQDPKTGEWIGTRPEQNTGMVDDQGNPLTRVSEKAIREAEAANAVSEKAQVGELSRTLAMSQESRAVRDQQLQEADFPLSQKLKRLQIAAGEDDARLRGSGQKSERELTTAMARLDPMADEAVQTLPSARQPEAKLKFMEERLRAAGYSEEDIRRALFTAAPDSGRGPFTTVAPQGISQIIQSLQQPELSPGPAQAPAPPPPSSAGEGTPGASTEEPQKTHVEGTQALAALAMRTLGDKEEGQFNFRGRQLYAVKKPDGGIELFELEQD